MNKTILILLLILSANSTWADWVKISESNGDSYYIDQTNIRKNGNFVKVWELLNLKEKKFEAASLVRLREYDCKDEKMRFLSITGFSNQMGAGIPSTKINEPGEWEFIQPSRSNIQAFILPLVCHEWIKVKEHFYFDAVNIRKNGQFVTSWILINLEQPNLAGVLSIRINNEFDCKGLKVRPRLLSAHSDSMAFGKIVYTEDSGDSTIEWMTINSDFYKNVQSIVCD